MCEGGGCGSKERVLELGCWADRVCGGASCRQVRESPLEEAKDCSEQGESLLLLLMLSRDMALRLPLLGTALEVQESAGLLEGRSSSSPPPSALLPSAMPAAAALGAPSKLLLLLRGKLSRELLEWWWLAGPLASVQLVEEEGKAVKEAARILDMLMEAPRLRGGGTWLSLEKRGRPEGELLADTMGLLLVLLAALSRPRPTPPLVKLLPLRFKQPLRTPAGDSLLPAPPTPPPPPAAAPTCMAADKSPPLLLLLLLLPLLALGMTTSPWLAWLKSSSEPLGLYRALSQKGDDMALSGPWISLASASARK